MDIHRPPAAHNAVRFLQSNVTETARRVYAFDRNKPRLSYSPAYSAIRDRVLWGLDHGTMIKMMERLKGEQRRKSNLSLIEAFIDSESSLPIVGLPAFDDDLVKFKLAAGLELPIKPTAIVAGDDRFNVFQCLGWSGQNLTDYQIRVWMTIYDDALFRLEDFRNANGVFATFPKINGQRELVMWERGDYDLLSMQELNDQLDMLSEAIRLAKEWARGE